jgi:hypothetical protein
MIWQECVGALLGGTNKMKWTSSILVAVVLAAAAMPASASIITFSVTLTGLNEVPANASPGIGTAFITLDDIAATLSVKMSFSGLVAAATAAHIHCCLGPGVNAPVVIPFTGFPNATSGTYSNTFTGISLANITGIEAYQAYINIHSSVYPGGEIRANLTPEPATLGLVGLALVGLLAFRRPRRLSA